MYLDRQNRSISDKLDWKKDKRLAQQRRASCFSSAGGYARVKVVLVYRKRGLVTKPVPGGGEAHSLYRQEAEIL